MLLLVGLVLGGVFGFKSFQSAMIKKYMGAMTKQPQTVSTTKASLQDWRSQIKAVGTLRAVRGVEISSEVAGIVEGLYFQSGDEITDGALLLKLRADDDAAALASLKADAHLAQITYQRDFKQLQEKAVAQAIVDISLASLEKANALVQEQEAKIAKKFIRAPFTGRLGLRAVDIGEYISPGTVIVTLQALDPIYFDFYLPQQDLARLKIGQGLNLRTDLQPDKLYPGKIWAINSKVDMSTRNVQVRAILDNKNSEILPGMYAVVEIDVGTQQKYITVPQTAITYNPYGDTVFLVKQQGTNDKSEPLLIAEQRFVTLGPTRGDQVAIIKGVAEGETVVTSGQMKLQNGSMLKINNSVAITNDIDPKPNDT